MRSRKKLPRRDGSWREKFFDVTRARSCQSVYLQHSYGTDGNTERFVRALYGRVCSEAVRHENHADLKPLSWQQKQLRDPDNYGISCMLLDLAAAAGAEELWHCSQVTPFCICLAMVGAA